MLGVDHNININQLNLWINWWIHVCMNYIDWGIAEWMHEQLDTWKDWWMYGWIEWFLNEWNDVLILALMLCCLLIFAVVSKILNSMRIALVNLFMIGLTTSLSLSLWSKHFKHQSRDGYMERWIGGWIDWILWTCMEGWILKKGIGSIPGFLLFVLYRYRPAKHFFLKNW